MSIEEVRARALANSEKLKQDKIEQEKRSLGELTQAHLKEILDYSPETGIFIRRTGNNKGLEAGYVTGDGYINIEVLGVDYPAHRLAWLYCKGTWPKEDIDHRDRDRKNNRIANLRDVSRSVNLYNRGPLKNNTSGVRNVYLDKNTGKWVVNRNQDGRRIYVGSYETLEEAAEEAKKYYGEVD